MIVGDKRLYNKKEVIQFLRECKETHKFYAENPKYCRGNIGSSQFHKIVYLQYSDAIKLLKEKNNEMDK